MASRSSVSHGVNRCRPVTWHDSGRSSGRISPDRRLVKAVRNASTNSRTLPAIRSAARSSMQLVHSGSGLGCEPQRH